MLSRGLWTAFHVKIIKYQNYRLVDAVILVYHTGWSITLDTPKFGYVQMYHDTPDFSKC